MKSLNLTKLKLILRLTRWQQHVPFTIPLTLVGSLLAVSGAGTNLDWRLLTVLIANVLSMSFAFIINDVEDAPDDKLDPIKTKSNVISSELVTETEGNYAAIATGFAALVFYGLSGGWAFLWGFVTVLVCYLYSARPIRLKSKPVTDVISHAFMLSGLLVMTGYFAYATSPRVGWYVILCATFFSAYGQFYQQIVDYEVDKKAGLKNTVVLLGPAKTKFLMYLASIGGIFCLVMAVILGAFPAWLGVVVAVAVGVCALVDWRTDMRGYSTDFTGSLQKPILIIFNVAMLMWLVHLIS
jgi:4-hydroxybenzoate polyprenyltransferase